MSERIDKKELNAVYSDGLQYIADELNKLDLIIQRRIVEFRAYLESGNTIQAISTCLSLMRRLTGCYRIQI